MKGKKPKKQRRISRIECISSWLNVKIIRGGLVEIKKYNKTSKCLILRVLGIDIFHYSDADKDSSFKNFASATMAIHSPSRYIFTDAHPRLDQQIEFLKYKLDKCDQRFSSALLRQQINGMKEIENEHRDRLAYLLLFCDAAEDENTLYEEADRYASQMIDTSVEIADYDQTVEFLHNYLGSKSNTVMPNNLDIKQNHIIVDGEYQTSVIIYDYPAILKNLELAALISYIPDATFVFDFESRSKARVLNELKISLRELKAREVLKQDVTEQDDTEVEFDKLREIRDNIANGAEQMIYTTLRLILSDSSYEDLERKVEKVLQKLEEEGISAYVPINDMQNEYFNRMSAVNEIKNPFPLNDTFKMQYPFYYQQHIDYNSLLFGYSGTGGLVNINFFERTPARPSYDMLLCGIKGSGKSVMLKSLVQDHLMLGHKIMVLDIESEYHALSEMFGGQVIKLNKDSRLNTLELHKVVDSAVEDDADASSEFAINFASEISRIITFFYQYIPDMNDLMAEELKDLLVETYQIKGITDHTDVTQIPSEVFPVFSDLLAVCRKKLYKNGISGTHNDLTNRKIEHLESIEVSIKQLSEGMYAGMFNGTSNIHIEDSNLIVFDVKSLSEMDDRIYNAQLFNILSLMWAETCKNAVYNRRISNSRDRRYVISVIDEAHRFVNSNNSHTTDFIEKECRRTRKYDAALWLASQSISDFNPIGNDTAAEKVRTIFSLIQYKIILKQSGESYDILCDTFKHFPPSELMGTKDYVPGEMLISFGSDRHKIHCVRKILDAHLLYIGNSRDAEAITHKFFDMFYNEKSHAEYGRMLADKSSYDNFVAIFSQEIENYYGYSREDSEYLYKLVVSAVTKLADELIDEGQRGGLR